MGYRTIRQPTLPEFKPDYQGPVQDSDIDEAEDLVFINFDGSSEYPVGGPKFYNHPDNPIAIYPRSEWAVQTEDIDNCRMWHNRLQNQSLLILTPPTSCQSIVFYLPSLPTGTTLSAEYFRKICNQTVKYPVISAHTLFSTLTGYKQFVLTCPTLSIDATHPVTPTKDNLFPYMRRASLEDLFHEIDKRESSRATIRQRALLFPKIPLHLNTQIAMPKKYVFPSFSFRLLKLVYATSVRQP